MSGSGMGVAAKVREKSCERGCNGDGKIYGVSVGGAVSAKKKGVRARRLWVWLEMGVTKPLF